MRMSFKFKESKFELFAIISMVMFVILFFSFPLEAFRSIRNPQPPEITTLNYDSKLLSDASVIQPQNGVPNTQQVQEYSKSQKEQQEKQAQAPIGCCLKSQAAQLAQQTQQGSYLFTFYRLRSLPSSAAAIRIDIFATIIAFILGVALFIFRLKLRFLFGVSEICVGFTVVLYRIDTGIDKLNIDVWLAILTAGIYLVVRGLDNIYIGLTVEASDPISKKISGFFFDKIP